MYMLRVTLMSVMQSANDQPLDDDTTAKEEMESKRRRLGLIRQWTASLFISTSYLIIGTSVGWSSPVLYNMRKTGVPLNLTRSETSVMVSLFYVGNIVMPIPSGILSDIKGRKLVILWMSTIPFASWLLILFARNAIMLHVARLLAGMWGGMVRTVVPLYIAEIAEPDVRGGLSTLATIFANFGILVAYALGQYVSYWTLAVMFGVIPVMFFICVIFIPESPYWLIYKGSEPKAIKSLTWLRGGKKESDVNEEIRRISLAVNSDLQKPKGAHNLITTKSNRRAFIIVEVLAIGQRLSGIGAIVAFSAITLPDKRVGLLTPNDAVIVIGIARLITVTVFIFVIDKLSRKLLLITSCCGCGMSMFAACLWFYFHQSTVEYRHHWVPFAAFLVYGCFFNIGLGPVVATIQGEMFPSHLKATASAITAIILASTSAIMSTCYLYIAYGVGMYVNYAIYTVACLSCMIFVWVYVLETKGKTLHQIQQELEDRHPKK